jgi:hypothetical protein
MKTSLVVLASILLLVSADALSQNKRWGFSDAFKEGLSRNQRQGQNVGVNSVAVIAPSVSTSMKANRIVAANQWSLTSPREASAVLVVVRSSLMFPLKSSHGSYKELEEDAGRQLNIAGPNYHVYLFRINDDLSVTEIDHQSFEAKD